MKATKQNYFIICEILYNLTGFEHWLNRYYNERAMKGNFITDFNFIRNYAKKLIKKGNIYKYPLYYLDRTAKKYVGNSVNL